MAGWLALEERKLRLTSAKVEVEVDAELGTNWFTMLDSCFEGVELCRPC